MNDVLQSMNLLLIEDDPDLQRLLSFRLQDLSCTTEVCDDGKKGLARALEGNFDLIILDVMLPSLSGFEICRALRDRCVFVPILMLTARDLEADKVIGLDAGADDYLTKPFGILEFLARAGALLRRKNQWSGKAHSHNNVLKIGDLEIDTARRKVLIGDKIIELTAKEYDLLCLLISNPGKPFSRLELLDRVWDYQSEAYQHTVTSHMNRLRQKLECDPASPKYLLTVWGVGYRAAEPHELAGK